MKYISTRGQAAEQNFNQILLGGLMQDGGLAMPASYPHLQPGELQAMRGMSYAELATNILSRFMAGEGGIEPADLAALIARTYTPDVYGNTRPDSSARDITPLRSLEKNLHILELSNGPTLAFKDMAMQLLGNLFEYALKKNGETLNILGATSGDTGSAAEYAMRGKQGIKVFMLSPHQKMSRFQTAQMFSLQDKNIFNIAVRGVFDDCQDIVKAVSNDLAFKQQYRIGTVNSINWARVSAQVVYYFKAYFSATKSNNEEVSFAVPSGNFGNICAGHVARMMGLPIKRLILATNENDVLDEFFRTGVYRPRTSSQTHHTSSPSMDISKASNFERFVFDLVDRNGAQVQQFWQQVDGGGVLDLRNTAFFEKMVQYGFVSGSSSHADRVATIAKTWRDYQVMIDPHTADALKVAQALRQPYENVIVLETALPAKFADTIHEALHAEPWRPAALQNIEDLPQRFEVMHADAEAIKQFMVEKIAG